MERPSANGQPPDKATPGHPYTDSPVKQPQLPPFGPHDGRYCANATPPQTSNNLTNHLANGTQTASLKSGKQSLTQLHTGYTFGPTDKFGSTNAQDGARNNTAIFDPMPPTLFPNTVSPSQAHSRVATSLPQDFAPLPTQLRAPQNRSLKCA
jgi:hypothetical protein